jgi:hypothetical protein
MASNNRGLQSKNPWRIEPRIVLMTSPVKRPNLSDLAASSSTVATFRATSSRKTATPCIGSSHNGPWEVASWKAYEILSEKSWGFRDGDVESVDPLVCSAGGFISRRLNYYYYYYYYYFPVRVGVTLMKVVFFGGMLLTVTYLWCCRPRCSGQSVLAQTPRSFLQHLPRRPDPLSLRHQTSPGVSA